MGSKSARGGQARDAVAELTAAPPMAVDEVNARYPGEWVLLLVTGEDEQHDPSHGHVLEHGASRARISQAVKRARAAFPTAQLYTFVGGPQILTGQEARERLAQTAMSWNDAHAGR